MLRIILCATYFLPLFWKFVLPKQMPKPFGFIPEIAFPSILMPPVWRTNVAFSGNQHVAAQRTSTLVTT